MIATLLGFALIASVASASDDIYVFQDWATVIDCGNGFCPGYTSYKLKSDSGDPIKLFCYTFKALPGTKVSFRDGVTSTKKGGQKLGYPNEYLFVAKTGEVSVYVHGDRASLQCAAKTIHPPRNVVEQTLGRSEPTKIFSAPDGSDDIPFDKAWQFKAKEGSNITMTCDVQLRSSFDTICAYDVLTIDYGKGPEEFCSNDQVTVTGTEVTMRLDAYKLWGGLTEVACAVRAVRA